MASPDWNDSKYLNKLIDEAIADNEEAKSFTKEEKEELRAYVTERFRNMMEEEEETETESETETVSEPDISREKVNINWNSNGKIKI